MKISVVITPKFVAQQLFDETIGKDWYRFQYKAMVIGRYLHQYMLHYLESNRHRERKTIGESITKYLDFQAEAGAGTGQVSWGIGHVPTLMTHVPYFHILNDGKKIGGGVFIPGGGKARPVVFTDGNADPNRRGTGGNAVTMMRKQSGHPIRAIRPIPYIDATQFKMLHEINKLLAETKSRVG